ncbi:hypothetical protein HGO40_11600 [Pseudomonas sp. CG7]|uniref:hypothetical protein n=1 Tax=Pseudomonas sp. CG7 TaxID=191007 RepID=UPI002033DBB2|nr:hypothetical protein [Pseudomonas sp. CG7]MCM2461122.1 hypothetical protein [Pseudomonas sp. CG7]
MPKTFYRTIQRINRVKPVTDQATAQAASAECSTPPAIKRQNGHPEDSRAFFDKTKAANALNQSTGFLGRKKKLIMENRSLENEHD